MEKALFGAGCFWGVEDFFRQVPGVIDAVSGYAGGTTQNPTYRQVCNDETYHAEVVEVTFDPAKVSYGTLVELFFRMHNPTQRNRQGPDIGTQYRSVIFCETPEQRTAAREVIAELVEEGLWRDPVVTEIAERATFYPGETYHPDYFARNGRQPYCAYVVAPKVAKFRKAFADRLKRDART